jgi:hypothetical protein
MKITRFSAGAGLILAILVSALNPAQAGPGRSGKPETPVIALTGGLLIDGNGGAPIPSAVVLIQGSSRPGPRQRSGSPKTPRGSTSAGKPSFRDSSIAMSTRPGRSRLRNPSPIRKPPLRSGPSI